MNQCNNCKHWERYKHEWGLCEMARGKSGDAEYPEGKAFAEDCESYSAWLNTRENFGCNQWELHDDRKIPTDK